MKPAVPWKCKQSKGLKNSMKIKKKTKENTKIFEFIYKSCLCIYKGLANIFECQKLNKKLNKI